MAPRKLPSELEEEILVCLPPLSLVRFRAVCKEWNTLFNAKRFVNNHFACARPEFLLRTESTIIYSIRVNLSEDPTIKVSDLSLNVLVYRNGNCDGHFLFTDGRKGTVVCNPWLRQTKRIDKPVDDPFTLCAIGYDSSKPEKSYKIFGYTYCLSQLRQYYVRFAMFEFETNAWKYIDHHVQNLEESVEELIYDNNVSLNGNVYWISNNENSGKSFIQILDFSKDIINPFCNLPCKKNDHNHANGLDIYKGDRFSLLEQCDLTRKIETWVTKNKISNGDAVVWIKFMTVSIPNFPRYGLYISSYYLVDNNIFGKTFVTCCSEGGKACVYVVRGDLCKKIEIAPRFSWSCVYFPSLIPLTLDRENKKNLQV